MPHVSVGAAIAAAEHDARHHWNGVAPPVHNCGANDEDFIYTDERATLMENWLDRGTFNAHGRAFDRRASESSGEAKVDLKLAAQGVQPHVPSEFNYHIKYQQRPPKKHDLTVAQERSKKRSEIENEINKIRRQEGKKGAYPGGPDWLKLTWIDK